VNLPFLSLGFAASLAFALPRPACAASRVQLADSVEARIPKVIRADLTAAESAAPLDVEIALRLRNFPELQARVQRGEAIPYAELVEKYLPDAADSARISAWCQSQGLSVQPADAHPLALFVRGTVAQVGSAFATRFARVKRAQAEVTSAVTPPSLPSEWASSVLAINGLQPRPVSALARPSLRPPPASGTLGVYAQGDAYIAPSDIATAYGATASQLTGAGQTIAIIMDYAPNSDDLTTFWSDCQIPQSLANITVVPVGGGPSANGHAFEASLDVEWTSGLAPGAKIRLYATPGISSLAQIDQALAQIISDLPANPSLQELSISIGLPESSYSQSQLQSSSQYFAVLASQGVTAFAGAGDGGSNPDQAFPEEYDPGAPLQVSYPASDPNVVAVGGTAPTFSSSDTLLSEVVWGLRSGVTYPDGYGYDATGGGYSVFPRPAWQAGLPGVAMAGRCVPDVAGPAMSNPFGLVIWNHGQALGVIGTSWATPVWAAFCALINQARAAAGEPPLGLLAPKLYALPPPGNFRAVTSGTNGAYSASPTAAYNLCTGLGVPIVTGLLKSLVQAPTFNAQPTGQTAAAGSSVTLNVSLAGLGPLSYQWARNGAAIAGATAPSYSLGPLATNQGGAYSVTVTNAMGSVSSIPAVVSVAVDACLVNLSTRALVGLGANLLETGFVVAGSGSKEVLLRAIGPTLSQFGVGGALSSLQLSLYNAAEAEIGANAIWGGGTALAALFTQVGAFALPAASADAAFVSSLTPAAYTAEVTGAGGASGVAMAEIYAADGGTAATCHLVNLSSRGMAGGGSDVLGAGFVITGTTSDTILIRAIGPTLGQFGVAGVLASPQLALFNSAGTQMASNAAWGGGSGLAAVFASVGAFALPPTSADCALLVTLPPGSYTAQVSGAAGSSGIALVEIYEVR